MAATPPPRRRTQGAVRALLLALTVLAACSQAPPAATRILPPIAAGGVRSGSPENCASVHGSYVMSPVRVRLPDAGSVMLPGPRWCIIASDDTGFVAMHEVAEPGAPPPPNGTLSVAERLHSALFSIRVFRAGAYFGAAPQTLETLRQRVAADARALLAARTVRRPDGPPLTVVTASAGEPIAGTTCVPLRSEVEGPVAEAVPPVMTVRATTSRFCLDPGVAVVELEVTEAFVKGDPDADRRGAGIRRLADEFFASLSLRAPPGSTAARE